MGNSLEHKKMSESWRAHAGDLSEHERLYRLRKLQVIVELMRTINLLIPVRPKPRKKRKKRLRKNQLPYHKRRRRVNWAQWVRELGPEDFYRHHRMHRSTFERLLTIVRPSISRDSNKCRYGSGPVTPRMQLTITLKHLADDSSHDIEKHMGVARPTVCKVIDRVLLAVVEKLGVEPFPLDDDAKLNEMAEVTELGSQSCLVTSSY